MAEEPEITARDIRAIRALVSIEYHEIRHFAEETRLRFNALAPARCFVLAVRAGGREGEVELIHWVVDDEGELVHSSLA